MSYLPLMLKQHDFGNICHEHLEYYSLRSLEYLLAHHGFLVSDVQLNDVNGGSIRVFIRNSGADDTLFADATYRKFAVERVRKMRAQEAKMGLNEAAAYLDFATWIERIRNDVRSFVQDRVLAGEKSSRVRRVN